MKNIDFGILPDLIGHPSEVFSVCYSPDGKTIASCSGDKTIKLWNPENGKEMISL
jgi:WD40 repeat protein